MNTTMDQTEMTENSMEMEKEMPEMMKANLAGEMEQSEEEINPINAVIGVVRNKINDLAEELDMADIEFARAHHNDKYSKATYDAEETCKLINAKKSVLENVLVSMEDMVSSMMPMSA